MTRFAVASLIVSAAFGQAPSKLTERTFTFINADTVQAQHELATLVRAEFEIADVRLDTDHRTLTILASAPTIAAAEWLIAELDQPAAPATAKPRASAAYNLDTEPAEAVRVFYLSGARTIQELQESATVIRSTAEIRRLFTYNAARAIAVRGTPAQLEAAEWIWNAIDNDAAQPEFRSKLAGSDSIIRVYKLPATVTVQELQESATLIRAIVEVRRMFTYNRTRSMIVRSTPEQAAAIDWLAAELAKPASPASAASEPFRMDDARGEGVIRVFRLPSKLTVSRLQALAVEVRAETRTRRLFTYNSPRLIAVRGTDAQLAQAAKLLETAR